MLRIDFYVQHLVKNGASAILLASNQPATFQFAAGPRKSNSPVPHQQLVQLVQEVAPPGGMDRVMQTGSVVFPYAGQGATLSVIVNAQSQTSWAVELRGDGGAAAQKAGGAPGGRAQSTQGMPAPMPGLPDLGGGGAQAAAEPVNKAPQKKESIKPPRIELMHGEPRLNLFLRQMVAVKRERPCTCRPTMPPLCGATAR
jgi:hypothetical protein